MIAFIPLAFPDIAPFTDLPGHMGRYAVQLDSDAFRGWYDFRPAIIGNLGVDLLVGVLSPVLSIELATKLIVMSIPPLTVAAMLWISREAHGEITPTTYFALPLAWNYPLIFGFVNFSLSVALALLAFAFWLFLARLGRFRLRAWLFLAIAPIIWISHVFGWGILGLLVFASEFARLRERGLSALRAVSHASINCLVLAPPILAMIVWRGENVGNSKVDGWFDWVGKLNWLQMSLRDRWQSFDKASFYLIALVLAFGFGSRKMSMSAPLAWGMLALLSAFSMLPWVLFGSAYADMRLAPYILAIALITLRPAASMNSLTVSLLALGAMSFYGVRVAASTASFAAVDARYDRALAALDHIEIGSRVAWFTQIECGGGWSTNRMEHLGAMAMVRRKAFSNDQWNVAGAQLVKILKADAPAFRNDPSQMIRPIWCNNERWKTLDQSLRLMPRSAFDYVWLIDPSPYDVRLTTGLRPVWRDGNDVLYRIDR